MRRLAAVLLALLASTAGAATHLPAYVELQMTDLHSGRAILPNGQLVSTGDGFRHWGASYRLTVPLHDLAAVNRYIAFAVGTDGRLHRTLTGGKSWARISGAPRLDRIVAADPAHLFATNRTGRLVTSSDGGTSWRLRSLAGVHSLCAVDSTVVLVGRQGAILRSTDAGLSFATVFRVPVARIARAPIELTCAHGGLWATLDDFGGAMSQQPYVLLQSSDGGRHWLPRLAEHFFPYWPAVDHAADGPPSVPVVAPTGPSSAVIAGGCEACGVGLTTVMVTRDGGRTWSGFRQRGRAESVPTVLDNANPLAIDFVDTRDGWLIVRDFRTSPRILRTTDGGRTWDFLAEL